MVVRWDGLLCSVGVCRKAQRQGVQGPLCERSTVALDLDILLLVVHTDVKICVQHGGAHGSSVQAPREFPYDNLKAELGKG